MMTTNINEDQVVSENGPVKEAKDPLIVGLVSIAVLFGVAIVAVLI